MSITNDIPRRQKIYFVRPGRYHVFGTDFERRDSMTDEEAVRRFDQTWNSCIINAITSGDVVEYEDAIGLIAENSRNFCYQDQEHRKFRLEGTVFVAQLRRVGDGYSHNQMWPVPAKNYDTRTLSVTFQTQNERDEWNRLAARLGYDPEDLGLRTLRALLLALGAAQTVTVSDGAPALASRGEPRRG